MSKEKWCEGGGLKNLPLINMHYHTYFLRSHVVDRYRASSHHRCSLVDASNGPTLPAWHPLANPINASGCPTLPAWHL